MPVPQVPQIVRAKHKHQLYQVSQVDSNGLHSSAVKFLNLIGQLEFNNILYLRALLSSLLRGKTLVYVM